MDGRLSRRSSSGLETLPEVWKWLGDPPGGPEVVGDPPGGVELVGRPSWIRNWLETLPEVRKCLQIVPEVWNWLGDPPGVPEVVGRLSWRVGKGLRPSRKCETGWQTLPEVRK